MVKKLAEFIRHIENFSNFVLGEHSDYCLYYFMFEHYKGTTIFANHQIFRQLIFIELTLIIGKNTALKRLMCGHNNLTSLDVSDNPSLDFLFCAYNNLTSIAVDKDSALTQLICTFNNLTSLNVSKAPSLKGLDCSNNQLTTLNVNKNRKLTSLDCANNKLTSIDVSQNRELTNLNCEGNLLTTLDLTQNRELNSLGCYNNNLSSEVIDSIISTLNDRCHGKFLIDEATVVSFLSQKQRTAIRAKSWQIGYYKDGSWHENYTNEEQKKQVTLLDIIPPKYRQQFIETLRKQKRPELLKKYGMP